MAVLFVRAPSKLSIILLILLYFLINLLIDVDNTNLKGNGLGKSLYWRKIRFDKCSRAIGNRRHKYLATRIPYVTRGVSYHQIRRIVLSGDIQVNPGPSTKIMQKRLRRDCG